MTGPDILEQMMRAKAEAESAGHVVNFLVCAPVTREHLKDAIEEKVRVVGLMTPVDLTTDTLKVFGIEVHAFEGCPLDSGVSFETRQSLEMFRFYYKDALRSGGLPPDEAFRVAYEYLRGAPLP